MNEMIKEWLKELYRGAIKDAEEAIATERLWANGAETEEAVQCHLGNINDQEAYIEVLKAKIAELG